MRDTTREFLSQHMERLKKESKEGLKYFVSALLAIFGDPGAAFQLVLGYWEQTPVDCPQCGRKGILMEWIKENRV